MGRGVVHSSWRQPSWPPQSMATGEDEEVAGAEKPVKNHSVFNKTGPTQLKT
jgi:hypothetical protein